MKKNGKNEIKIDATPEQFFRSLQSEGLVKNIKPLTKQEQEEAVKRMFGNIK